LSGGIRQCEMFTDRAPPVLRVVGGAPAVPLPFLTLTDEKKTGKTDAGSFTLKAFLICLLIGAGPWARRGFVRRYYTRGAQGAVVFM